MGCLPTQQNICEYLTSHWSQNMEVQVVVLSQAKAMVFTFYLINCWVVDYLSLRIKLRTGTRTIPGFFEEF